MTSSSITGGASGGGGGVASEVDGVGSNRDRARAKPKGWNGVSSRGRDQNEGPVWVQTKAS